MTPERLAKDPANRLLSRGPRFRLDAEMLRDQALFVSGLLVGEGRRPERQAAAAGRPVGGGRLHRQQHGQLRTPTRATRRSTAAACTPSGSAPSPPPQMSTFDAPSRESCIVRRERTNTPLQALLLLNEPQYVEAARALAERTMHEGGDDAGGAPGLSCSALATARQPDASELAELVAAYHGPAGATTRATTRRRARS